MSTELVPYTPPAARPRWRHALELILGWLWLVILPAVGWLATVALPLVLALLGAGSVPVGVVATVELIGYAVLVAWRAET